MNQSGVTTSFEYFITGGAAVRFSYFFESKSIFISNRFIWLIQIAQVIVNEKKNYIIKIDGYSYFSRQIYYIVTVVKKKNKLNN